MDLRVNTSLDHSGVSLHQTEQKASFPKLLQRVYRTVIALLNKFRNIFYASPLKLTKKEIRILNRSKHPVDTAEQKKTVNPKKYNFTVHETSTIRKLGLSFNEEEPLPKFSDPVYQEVHDVLQEHIKFSITAILEEKFDPKVQTLQKDLEEASFWIKLIADVAVTVVIIHQNRSLKN